jgi:hypothetical protein
MPRARDLHVIPNSDRRGWGLWRAGRKVSRHRTQKRAVLVGLRIARRTRVDLVTHGRGGRIRSKESYGNETAVRDKEH